jgi:hypothetical protein
VSDKNSRKMPSNPRNTGENTDNPGPEPVVYGGGFVGRISGKILSGSSGRDAVRVVFFRPAYVWENRKYYAGDRIGNADIRRAYNFPG